MCLSSEIWTRLGRNEEIYLAETRPPIRAPAHDAYGRAERGRSATANRDAHRDADVSEHADGCRPPSGDRVGDIDEDFRLRRKLRPPPSGNPPYSGSPRCEKPVHSPPRRCYHAALSRDSLRPARPTTSCSPPDEQRCSRIMIAASCGPPSILASILPETHRRIDPPPPVKESVFSKILRDYRFHNSNFIICDDEVVINRLNFS